MKDRKIYDVFISYSRKDTDIALLLTQHLIKAGISVFLDLDMEVGFDWRSAIAQAISSSKIFIPLITENAVASQVVEHEVSFALDQANDRSKIILPLRVGEVDWRKSSIKYRLTGYQFIYARSDEPEEMRDAAKKITEVILSQKNEATLYEKLSECMKSQAYDRAIELLCDLICVKHRQILTMVQSSELRELLGELIMIMEMLCDLCYRCDVIDALTDRIANALAEVRRLLEIKELHSKDLYYISIALRLIYFDCELRAVCNTGNSGMTESYADKAYEEKQKLYLNMYHLEMQEQDIGKTGKNKYPENEWKFILQTPEYICRTRRKESAPAPQETLSDDDTLLRSVADFMQQGNRVLDIIGQRGMAEEFLRCLILSYERLKSYCEVVGEKAVCAECIDRIFELKEKLENAQTNCVNDKAETGIKTLLGLTVPKSGKFDVFISHKREDIDIASDMYHFMKKNMKEVFFDKYSLPEMSESQYRKAIMQALDGSTHFVVIFSDLSYLDSYWVKLEMEIFQSEIDEGRKPKSNFIMVVTGDVYKTIMESNKSILPIEYRRCEIMRVEDYKKTLLRYFDK